MTINKSFPAELNKKETYFLTKAPNIGKMRDVIDQEIDVTKWVLYQDDQSEILSLMTAEDEVYATNSATMIRDFSDIAEIFGDCPWTVKVISNTSKNGREYLSCVYVDR